MKGGSRISFNKPAVAIALIVLAGALFRHKLLSWLCLCVLKICLAGLGYVELHNFQAGYRAGEGINISSGLTWRGSQQLGSLEKLQLRVDLSKLYEERRAYVDLRASGLNVNLSGLDLSEHRLGHSFVVPRLVEVKDARLKYRNESYDLSVSTELKGPTSVVSVSMFDGARKGQATLSRLNGVNLKFDAMPAWLVSGTLGADKVLDGHDFSGEFDMTNEGAVRAEFRLSGGGELSLAAKIDKLGRVSIQQATLVSSKKKDRIGITGEIASRNQMSLRVQADSLSADFIRSFVEIGRPTNTKKWCQRSIKDGVLTNLDAHLNLKANFFGGPSVSVVGQSKFSRLSLKYAQALPQIDQLEGVATFDDKQILFDIDEGKLGSARLEPSKVAINLLDRNLPLTIDTRAVGPIKDFIGFIPEKTLGKLEARKIRLGEVLGSANARVTMRIPLAQEAVLRNMQLSVQAQLKEFQLLAFDCANLKGDLALNIENHLLSLDGKPTLNGEGTSFRFESHLTRASQFDNKLEIGASLGKPSGLLSAFDDKVVISEGLVPTTLKYLEKDGQEQLSVQANLSEAQVSIPYLSIVKKPLEAAYFELNMEKSQNVWSTTKCEFVAPQEATKIQAEARFTHDFSELLGLNAVVESAENNLKVDLAHAKAEYQLRLNGSSVALSKDQMRQLLGGDSLAHGSRLSVSINLDKATLRHGVTLNKISGRLSCYKNKCTKDAITMQIQDGNGPSANTKVYNDRGAFIVQTDSAFALLKGLDLYQDLKGGTMQLTLYPSKGASKAIKEVRGKLQIKNFRAIKTPLIGKLILLSPFAQIVERLKGQTLISFHTLNASFVVKDKVVEVYNAKAVGDLLTITISGHLDLLQEQIALQGRIIPNSLFNNLLSSIQNDRDAPTEGYKLGTDYKIYGSLSKPSVTVSPVGILISLLTKPLSII